MKTTLPLVGDPHPTRAPGWDRALWVVMLLAAVSCSRTDSPHVPKAGTSYDPETGLPLEIVSVHDGAEMVLVRAGAFRRGEPDGANRVAQMAAFYIDKYEVTNERYCRFTSATGRPTPSLAPGEQSRDALLFRWEHGRYPDGREAYPVVYVSFEDATAFAKWAGKKLPTQMQWEYAARSPDNREFPWGNAKLSVSECNTADRLAGRELLSADMWHEWYVRWVGLDPAERNGGALTRVGSLPRDVSPAGCFDLGGNVREWCIRRSDNGYADGEAGGYVATNTHVVCGGSWLRRCEMARAWRTSIAESPRCYDVGFRCVVPAADPAVQALARPQTAAASAE